MFPDHALLGEEGGVVEGDPGSDWLWCIDPLDGTTNFAHGYPSFATSIGARGSRATRALCCAQALRNFPPACDMAVRGNSDTPLAWARR